jgi:hypothetical protein
LNHKGTKNTKKRSMPLPFAPLAPFAVQTAPVYVVMEGVKERGSGMDQGERRKNEKKFGAWVELPDGGRRYWYEVRGRLGWKARYVKEVDQDERTVKFYQEICDSQGILVETHEKYPVDKGHQKSRGG